MNPHDSSAPRLLEDLVRQAQAAGASDIHLQMLGKAAQVSFRLDGVMTPTSTLAEDVAERVFGRIKFLSKLKTYQNSFPQEGRIDKAELGIACDVRVATYPTVTGEKVVLRLFSVSPAQSLSDLGLPGAALADLGAFLRRTSGLLLLTGPAGSGKTTTIYACLRRLVELGGRHVITIEDPAEQVLPGIMQTEVNEARGLTFAQAARHVLRQDPQVLVVGEIRDEETANLVVRAALTGHSVIATLHAGSCRGVIERLLDLCDDSYSAISALELILNQRLIRRLCPECHGGLVGSDRVADHFPTSHLISACRHCLQTGYRGRVPLVEWITVDENLRTAVRARGPGEVQPAHSLLVGGRELLRNRLSDEKEVQRVLGIDLHA